MGCANGERANSNHTKLLESMPLNIQLPRLRAGKLSRALPFASIGLTTCLCLQAVPLSALDAQQINLRSAPIIGN